MLSAMEDENNLRGLEALRRLKSAEPPLYLTPSPELSSAARLASEHVFALLTPYAPKSSLCRLYTEGFDEEQIWQQIDLQARPLLSKLRQRLRNFEKNVGEIAKQFNVDEASGRAEDGNAVASEDVDDGEEDENEGEMDDEEEDVEEEEKENDDDDETEGEEYAVHDDGEMDNRPIQNRNVVEDEFLKIRELEDYLLEDEAREFGLNKKNKRKRSGTDDEDGEGAREDADEEDELGLTMGLDSDDDDGVMENARYEDFFLDGKTMKKKISRSSFGTDKMGMDYQSKDDTDQQNGVLSTHEKEQQKLQSEIEKLERANLEPKTWTMQGEVTASKRPKNSALEVDLDFEHNVRPAPVITEEVTESLEELIKNRIVEGRFDDIQKRPSLPPKAPREKIELDESKSKKGLAELYEEEYAQKTGLVSNALSFSDEQKKEASMLFKKLCVKLDALSHFYYTPRPVIEDMSIQANVPALAIEEVAPLAVSDAAMLAPEEIFSSKGDVRDEAELTKEDRKRRRAKKKRKIKAEAAKRTIIEPQPNTWKIKDGGNKSS